MGALEEGQHDVELENTLNLSCTKLGVEEEAEIQGAVRIILQGLSEDINREGIKKTPLRVAKALRYATKGSVGLSFLQFTNMNSVRNLFIVGVSMFLGLSIPNYFREYSALALHGPSHTKAGWFNDFLNTIFSSSPAVALIISVLLDNTLEYKDSAKDRGMPWWVKFRTFKEDSRNEEFYTLPFNLNRFFPPS